MGRMKDLFIDQMNNQQHPDDTDWDAPTYDSAGFTEADRVVDEDGISPVEYDERTGKYLFMIKSIKDDCEYKIWAYSYKQACELLPMIESF